MTLELLPSLSDREDQEKERQERGREGEGETSVIDQDFKTSIGRPNLGAWGW